LILLVKTFIGNRASRRRHLDRSVDKFNIVNISLYLLVQVLVFKSVMAQCCRFSLDSLCCRRISQCNRIPDYRG